MLSDSCPECNTPLFQLKDGTIVCPMCQREVKKVSADTDTEALAQQNRIDATLQNKIKQVEKLLDEEMDPAKITELTDTLMKLLDAREQLKKRATKTG